MGKGDKKTRRGKIIIGTFGVRRRRKKADKPGIAPLVATKDIESKAKKAIKETGEVKPAAPKEKAPVKAAKPVKEKKEVKTEKPEKAEKTAKEPKPKKEKKSE